jgi:hypothetical protein
MGLSRLWQQQGTRAEAHELLAEVYGRFTEGFDTADLQDVKALLDELASSSTHQWKGWRQRAATASISSFKFGVASAATCTSVLAG